MQKLLKIVAVIAILILVPQIIQRIMFSESKAELTKKMMAVVDTVNKDLPKRIDSSTTLTKAEFRPGSSVYRVYYTMNPGIDIDRKLRDAYTDYAVRQICGGNMKIFLDKQITIEFLYTYNPDGRDDQEMTIAVPPNSCK